MNLQGQDWNPVVIKKRTPTAAQMKDESTVNAVGGQARLWWGFPALGVAWIIQRT